MASLRDDDVTTVDGGQGIVRILKLANCVTGDTITTPPNKLVQVVNEETADATNAVYTASTGLTAITVANTPDIALIVWL